MHAPALAYLFENYSSYLLRLDRQTMHCFSKFDYKFAWSADCYAGNGFKVYHLVVCHILTTRCFMSNRTLFGSPAHHSGIGFNPSYKSASGTYLLSIQRPVEMLIHTSLQCSHRNDDIAQFIALHEPTSGFSYRMTIYMLPVLYRPVFFTCTCVAVCCSCPRGPWLCWRPSGLYPCVSLSSARNCVPVSA